jgi:hypothetical protein
MEAAGKKLARQGPDHFSVDELSVVKLGISPCKRNRKAVVSV